MTKERVKPEYFMLGLMKYGSNIQTIALKCCYWSEHCFFSQNRVLEATKNEASRQEYGATSKTLLMSERESSC